MEANAGNWLMTTSLMNWTETHWYHEWSIPIERETDRVPFTLQVPMNTTQPPRSSILFFSLWTRNKTLVRTLPVDWFTELCTVINIPFTFNQPPFDTHYVLAHCSQRKPFYWQCFHAPWMSGVVGNSDKGDTSLKLSTFTPSLVPSLLRLSFQNNGNYG